jgi:hypothetical protein
MPASVSAAIHSLLAGREGLLTLGAAFAGLSLVAGGMWFGRLREHRSALRPKRAPFDPGTGARPVVPPAGSGQRKADRTAGHWTRVTLMDLQAGGDLFEGRVVDYDSNGLGIMLFKEVPVGHILSVRPSRAPAQAPWVRAEIRSCHQIEKCVWRVGCHVTDQSLASLLRQYA